MDSANGSFFHGIYRCAIQNDGDMNRFDNLTICNTLHYSNL